MLIEEHELHHVANEVMNMVHQEELEAINNFHDAIKEKDIEKIDALFKVLLESVEDHFKTEEDMMEQFAYRSMDVHKKDHDLMRKKLEKFHKRWEVLKSPKEIQSFMEGDFKKWVIQHVAKWDAETASKLGTNIEY